ncbi:YraN family protein [Marinobacter sp. SS5-14b]|uniref:YraN family protein n=1 Tax=Marinobacter sp. SS5-14b TaxID=3050456 RepID=UPI0026E016E1|nr:YraN family protein [Marinobacter sp. SS5-14b]
MEGTRALGNYYEGVAARYLASRGVEILDRNVYNRGGEIDLIGLDEQVLVFFEVRYRKANSLVDPISSITMSKQQRLLKAASFYLHRHNLWDADARIDVIGITPGSTSKYRVQWIKNAIQAG